MLRNDPFLPRNNGNHSESIPRNFFGTKFRSQPYLQLSLNFDVSIHVQTHYNKDERRVSVTQHHFAHQVRNLHVRLLKHVKGTVPRGGYFFKGPNILMCTFCVCTDGFQGLILSLSPPYNVQLLNFYLLPWNYLLILKMLTETPFKIPFSVIGRCSLVPTSHWLQGKCARINLSQNQKRLPVCIFSVKIAAWGSLKRVTGRIFKISK